MHWPEECTRPFFFFFCLFLFSIHIKWQPNLRTFKLFFSYQRQLYKSHKCHLLSFLYTRAASHSAAQRHAPSIKKPRVKCDCVATVYSAALYIPLHLPNNPPVPKLTFCLSLRTPSFSKVRVFYMVLSTTGCSFLLLSLVQSSKPYKCFSCSRWARLESWQVDGLRWDSVLTDCETFKHSSLKCSRCYIPAKCY